MFSDTIKFLQKKKTEKKNRKKKTFRFVFIFQAGDNSGRPRHEVYQVTGIFSHWTEQLRDYLLISCLCKSPSLAPRYIMISAQRRDRYINSQTRFTQIAWFSAGASHRGNWPFSRDVKSNIFHFSYSCVFLKELMEHFNPVFRHFFLERFPDPAVWFERRLSYTRGVATSSIGTVIRFVVQFQKTF